MRPMCETSNRPAFDLTARALVEDARVLHRHIPAAEGHHPPAELEVGIVQGSPLEVARLCHRILGPSAYPGGIGRAPFDEHGATEGPPL